MLKVTIPRKFIHLIFFFQLFGFVAIRVVPTFMAMGCAAFSLVSTMDRICSGGAGKNGSTVAGTSVITPAIPMLFVIIPAVTLAVKSEENIYEQGRLKKNSSKF
jgi:hypothetical protein